MKRRNAAWRWLVVLELLSLLAACRRNDSSLRSTPYLPPTAAQAAILTPSPRPAETQAPRPTAAPSCRPGLTFVEDVTIPDGTLVAPGDSLDKRWQVRNSGTCNWDERYRLKLIAGPALGAPPEQALYPARSGVEVTLRIAFTAPLEPGTYRSAWQAYDPDGNPFGDAVFIEVIVP